MTMRLAGLFCLMAACGPVSTRADGGAGGGGTSLLTGGGFGGSIGGGSAAGGNAGGGSAGGSATGGGSAMCGAGGPLQLQQLHGTFAANTPGGTLFRGGFDSATRQAFMLPLSVTPTLRTLHTVRLEDDGSTLRDGGSRAFVEALPLSGTIPTGNLTATAFDEQTNVLTGLYFSKAPYHYEVAQLTVSDGGARFTTLTSVDSPDANGFLFQNLEGTSSQLGAIGGNAVLPLTITGTQAQWGMGVSGQPYSDLTAYDRDANRVLSIGSYQFVPPMGARWLPTIQERRPTAPNWSTIAMTGTGLPSVEPGLPRPYPFIAWDAVGGRLLVTGTRPEMFGGMTVMVPTAIEADLRTRQWRVLPNNISSIFMRAPFITDRQFRQVFGPDFSAISLAPGRELSQTPLKLTGALPPNYFSSLSSASRLPDGRVVVSSNGTLFTFDPATTRWTALTARLPMAQSAGVTMAFDAVGQRTLILFGQDSGTPSASIIALSTDGTTTTPVATTGTAPSARSYASALVVGTTLVVSGGVADTQTLGDVYALDLTSLVWRKVTDVTPRQQPVLTLVDGAVFIVGGRTSALPFVPIVERVDLTTNQVRTVAATGTAPIGYAAFAPLGNGLVGFDIGMSYDFGSNQLFELKLENNTAVWTNSDPRAMDQAISPLIGVPGANCNEALFVGSSSFKVSR